MTLKAKLATILRHWADRLSPVPAPSWSPATSTYVIYGGDNGDGVIRYPATTTAPPMVSDVHFNGGGGWSPA